MTEASQDDVNNPNPFIGIILLIVLVVFVLPDRLPQFVSDLSPYFFAGTPCARLPAARELAAHQSVIGRLVQDPLRLDVAPATLGDDGSFLVRLTVTNASMGTVPIVFQEDNFVVAETQASSDGFGFVVSPAPAEGLNGREDSNLSGFAESDIRLLGPRQRCVHSVEWVASPQMIDGGGTVRAYYQMSIAGDQQPQSDSTRNIYPDQGLDILSKGVLYSEEIEIMANATETDPE